jgi:hypothetical protein
VLQIRRLLSGLNEQQVLQIRRLLSGLNEQQALRTRRLLNIGGQATRRMSDRQIYDPVAGQSKLAEASSAVTTPPVRSLEAEIPLALSVSTPSALQWPSGALVITATTVLQSSATVSLAAGVARFADTVALPLASIDALANDIVWRSIELLKERLDSLWLTDYAVQMGRSGTYMFDGLGRLYVDRNTLAATCKNNGPIHVLLIYKHIFRTSGLDLVYLLLSHLLVHAYLLKFIVEILIPMLWLLVVVEYLKRKIFVVLERLDLRTTDELSRWKELLQDLLKRKPKNRKRFHWLRFSEALQHHFVASKAYPLLLHILHDSLRQEYGVSV